MCSLVGALKGAARAGLGLFVVGQLAFLLWSNLAGVAPPLGAALRRHPRLGPLAPPGWGKDEAPAPVASLRKASAWWEEFSAQEQHWQLFAPELTDVIP